jgi:hypothetical protein
MFDVSDSEDDEEFEPGTDQSDADPDLDDTEMEVDTDQDDDDEVPFGYVLAGESGSVQRPIDLD